MDSPKVKRSHIRWMVCRHIWSGNAMEGPGFMMHWLSQRGTCGGGGAPGGQTDRQTDRQADRQTDRAVRPVLRLLAPRALVRDSGLGRRGSPPWLGRGGGTTVAHFRSILQ